MTVKATTVKEYLDAIPDDRKKVMTKIRGVINKNLPKGFKHQLSYGMPGWVIPHSKYPDGYHCKPELPVPFMSIASQKNFVALYHSGVYADTKLYDWFVSEYPKHCSRKLDMGKSCIRFKKMEDIPYDLIGELSTKMTPDDFIEIYENNIKKK
ncbi:MAG: DUF1801 domain-containing protein [Saprospiraceae bacterium]